MGNFNNVLQTTVFFSDGNSKMGNIPSVSLTPVVTCMNCNECSKHCYARKLYMMRPVLREQYDSNMRIALTDPELYWSDVDRVLSCARSFRFHVAGDILNTDYLVRMITVAKAHPETDILVFTKAYELVNQWLEEHHILPKNLHLLFSVWRNTPYENPYGLPEAHVLYRDGTTTAHGDMQLCNGNCAMCFCEEKGCIKMKRHKDGHVDEIVFKQH